MSWSPTWVPAPVEVDSTRSGEGNQQLQRNVKYGAGILAGVVVFTWLKKKIKKIPVVGVIAAPVLEIIPATWIGAALGAAVVYGVEEGDLLAAKRKILPKVKHRVQQVQQQVTDLAKELQQDLQEFSKSSQQQQLLPPGSYSDPLPLHSLESTLKDMEGQVVPVLERGYRQLQNDLQSLEHQGKSWWEQHQGQLEPSR